MRIPTLAILAIAAVPMAAPAQAQTYDPSYPFGVQVYQGFVDYYFDCTYRTMGQCQASHRAQRPRAWLTPMMPGRAENRALATGGRIGTED